MEQSDEEIIGQVLAGRKQAFGELIIRYQRPIYNLMYRYSHSETDATDLTQEVFVRAYEKLHTYKPGNSFFSWLYTLSVNRATDWTRKRDRRNRNYEKIVDHFSSRQENISRQENLLENKENIQWLQQTLLMLPDMTREILILRFREDLPVKEVAGIFSISESAVKMRTARGLQQLQNLMQVGIDETK